MSDRSRTISKLKESAASRAAYIKGKLSVLIAAQLRALRLGSDTPKQEDLALAANMKQSRISAMETPGAVNFNLETLVRMAATLKVALVVKFVSFGEMLRWENEFTQDTFSPVTIEHDPEFICEPTPGPTLGAIRSSGLVGGFTEQQHSRGPYPLEAGAASALTPCQLTN